MIQYVVSAIDESKDSLGAATRFRERKVFPKIEEAREYIAQHIRKYNPDASESDLEKFYRITRIDTLKCPQWEEYFSVGKRKPIVLKCTR